MCGIVGFVGAIDAENFLLEGLRRLEYRGYDSAGVATLNAAGGWDMVKAAGKIEKLAHRLQSRHVHGAAGIGHTRWATHGPATDQNAHPHFGGNETVAVVHNGVIENYQTLKERLIAEGYVARDNFLGGYRVTSEAQYLGSGFKGLPLVIEASRPWAVKLTRKIKWPVSIATMHDGRLSVDFTTAAISPWAFPFKTLHLRLSLANTAMATAITTITCP